MIFTKIWERYFVKECLKMFFLFLFCFYGLYIIIDYASHTSALPHHDTQIRGIELVRYYVYIFASRAEILIPFALIISVIKTVCRLNSCQELVALQASGIGLKQLARPFVLLGLMAVGLLYLNEQFILPSAEKKLRRIEDKSKHQKRRNHPDLVVQSMELSDGSFLLFQSYDNAKDEFFDVFWIRSIDEIFRMRTLEPHSSPPFGKWVEHFIRHSNGQLLLEASFEKLSFPSLHFNSELLESNLIDPETFSISQLIEKMSISPVLTNNKHHELTEKENKLLTAFVWRILLPWLSLIAIVAPLPYCMSFSRQLPIFLIYVCSLFGLVAFYLMMDAALVIANRQVLNPILALGLPFGTVALLCIWRYVKMR